MYRLIFGLILILGLSVTRAGNLGDQFLTARLQYGATLAIPKSWQVLQGDKMKVIEAAVGAAIDLSGYARIVDGAETLLVSNFPDPKLYAGVVVTSASIPNVTANLPALLSDSQVSAGEATIRKGIEATLSRASMKVWGWTPLHKVVVGNKTLMHISYQRSSDTGDRRVHLYKFFGAGRIYDIALSSSMAGEKVNNLILEKILTSFTAP